MIKISALLKHVPRSPSGWAIGFLKQFGVVLIYCGSAGLGVDMALLDKTAPLVWPPSGVAIAIVLLFGFRYLGAFAIGAAITDLWQGSGWLYSLLSAVSFTVTIALAVFALKKMVNFSNSLEKLKDVLGFILIATLLGTFAHATISTGILIWQYPEFKPDIDRIWSIRWLGQCLGMIVLGPFLLVWFSRTRINFTNRQAAEVLVWLGTLIFFGAMVFGNWAPSDTLSYPLELAIFPILAWSAIRFGQRGATIGILILFIMAVWELQDVVGPDAIKMHSQPPLFLWVFVGILSLTGLSLAAILTEYKSREEVIRQNEQRLRAFLDAMPDIAYIISAQGRYLEVFSSPSSFPSHLTDAAKEIKGKTYFDIYPPEIAERFHTAVVETIQTGQLQVIEYARSRKGKEMWFEGRLARMAPDEENGESRVIWMAYDITKRKNALKSIEARDRLLGGIAKAKTSLLTIKDYDQAIRRAVDTLGETAGVDRVYVFENHNGPANDSPGMSLRFLWPEDSSEEEIGGSFLQNISYQDKLPGWYETLSEAGAIQGYSKDFSTNVRKLFSWPEELSALFVPIFRDTEYWGIIGFASFQQSHKWQESEVAVFTAVAASIGGFIESKRTEMALLHAKNAADAASSAKGEFLAMMSHEIRTPMNAILGFADLLEQTDIQPEQEEYLQIINRSGKALLELINNVLDFSKIDSQTIELEEAPFKLEVAVLEALELVHIKAKDKNIGLNYNVKDNSSGVFIGDFHRLRQILLNLINNAEKFTFEGEVSVEVETRKLEGSDWEILFAVKDTGIGIPADKVERLFAPFSQVDSSTTREYGGTGLGLVICKRLSEKMGGRIWVESQPERGSTFYFTIVARESGEIAQAKTPLKFSHVNRDFSSDFPLKILVAEDNPVNRRLMFEILSNIGYKAHLAENGKEVLGSIKNGQFDLLLMDLQLPDMSGLEITRRIRSGECGEGRKSIYIIAVTAFALKEDREKCLAEGIDDHVPKPVVLNHLKEALAGAHKSVNRASR